METPGLSSLCPSRDLRRVAFGCVCLCPAFALGVKFSGDLGQVTRTTLCDCLSSNATARILEILREWCSPCCRGLRSVSLLGRKADWLLLGVGQGCSSSCLCSARENPKSGCHGGVWVMQRTLTWILLHRGVRRAQEGSYARHEAISRSLSFSGISRSSFLALLCSLKLKIMPFPQLILVVLHILKCRSDRDAEELIF